MLKEHFINAIKYKNKYNNEPAPSYPRLKMMIKLS